MELTYTQHFKHMFLERQIDWLRIGRAITEPEKQKNLGTVRGIMYAGS